LLCFDCRMIYVLNSTHATDIEENKIILMSGSPSKNIHTLHRQKQKHPHMHLETKKWE